MTAGSGVYVMANKTVLTEEWRDGKLQGSGAV